MTVTLADSEAERIADMVEALSTLQPDEVPGHAYDDGMQADATMYADELRERVKMDTDGDLPTKNVLTPSEAKTAWHEVQHEPDPWERMQIVRRATSGYDPNAAAEILFGMVAQLNYADLYGGEDGD